MKFDVIVGNPPYQNPDAGAKRWPLWQQFVELSMNHAEHVALVVPQTIVSPGNTFTRIREHLLKLDMTAAKHFANVGSTFCYFILDTNSTSSTTVINTTEGVYTIDISSLPFLPPVINDISLKQIDLLVSRTRRTWTRGELHTVNSELFTEHGRYECIHTNVQTLRTNTEHSNRTKTRVAVTTSGHPIFVVVTDQYLSQNFFWTEFDSMIEAREFATECNSSEIQSWLRTFKWNGWNSREVISCL